MKRELQRKFFHVVFGIIFLLLVYFAGAERSFYIIGGLFFIGLVISLAIRRGHKFKVFRKIVSTVEREYEKAFPGKAAILFFASALILLAVFSSRADIVLAGMSVGIFGDAAAALIGTKFGKHKIGFKNSAEGTIAGFVVTLACISYFFSPLVFPFWLILIPALLATIAEYLPVNDNFLMPLAASGGLYLLLLAL